MNYEISDYLEQAFLAGWAQRGEEDVKAVELHMKHPVVHADTKAECHVCTWGDAAKAIRALGTEQAEEEEHET